MLHIKAITQNITIYGLISWCAEKRYVSYTDRLYTIARTTPCNKLTNLNFDFNENIFRYLSKYRNKSNEYCFQSIK
jgi:hypothetical protein